MVDSISDVGGVGIAESSSVGESIDIGISLSITLAIDSDSINAMAIDTRDHSLDSSGDNGVAIGADNRNSVDDGRISLSISLRLSLSLTLAVDSIVDTRIGVAVDSTIVTNSPIHSIVEIRISLSLRLSLTLAIDYSMAIVGGDIAMVAIHSVMNSEPIGCVPGVSFSLTLAIDNMVSNTGIGVAIDSTIVTNSTVHSIVEVRISLSLSLSLGVAPSDS